MSCRDQHRSGRTCVPPQSVRSKLLPYAQTERNTNNLDALSWISKECRYGDIWHAGCTLHGLMGFRPHQVLVTSNTDAVIGRGGLCNRGVSRSRASPFSLEEYDLVCPEAAWSNATSNAR